MAIETVAEYGEPDRELTDQVPRAREPVQADAVLRTRATATILGLLDERPAAIQEIREMLRIRVYLKELTRRGDAAARVAADAELRESALAIKLDPAGHRVLGFGLGAVAVVALMILDAVPLNWAAQAFDLDPGGTWLVTLLLVAASVGAMLGFEFTRGNPRRRGALTAAVTTGYLALLGLRTEFLTTVAGDSLLIAFLQSALLTAISAGLVWCGSAILGRTRSLGHSRARAAGTAGGTGGRRGQGGAVPGRREARAPRRQSPPHALPLGAQFGGSGRRGPRRMGGRARPGHPSPLPGSVTACATAVTGRSLLIEDREGGSPRPR